MNNLVEWLISLSILIILISSFFIIFLKEQNTGSLPYYALRDERTKEAYTFAKENQDALNGINCHCGCMEAIHNGRIHKRGLLDCFIKEDNTFEPHGAGCEMCVYDTLQVKQLYREGKNKDKIKSIIDGKYTSLVL